MTAEFVFSLFLLKNNKKKPHAGTIIINETRNRENLRTLEYITTAPNTKPAEPGWEATTGRLAWWAKWGAPEHIEALVVAN